MYNSNCWPSTMLLRAGNDLPLGTVVPEGSWNEALRDGKGSVEVTSVANFNVEKDYKAGDYTSTGAYVSRNLVQHFYRFNADHSAGTLDLAAEAAKENGIVTEVSKEDIADAIRAQSDVQYYYIRICALRTLYTEANIMAAHNGYDLRKVADLAVEGIAQGSNAEILIAAEGIEPKSVTYTILNGSLPEGMALGADGRITGIPVGYAGTFEAVVRVVYDSWIKADQKVTISVDPAFTYIENGPAQIGKNYVGAVDTEVFMDSELSYSMSGKLPGGLEFDAGTGEIAGVPEEEGTFDVVITIGVKETVQQGNRVTTTTKSYHVPVKFVIGEEAE
ncbi:MAG: putative Ig domain-containing protein [Lachnospiraceae bacterium]|nr:putative Ig domain-containing protein [Lachnospiraceae bacterium]